MTTLKFLDNTFLFSSKSLVQSIQKIGSQELIILDETIFYPQGGGQPFDTGIIFSEAGKFQVQDVRLNQEGIVQHFGFFEAGFFKEGDLVSLEINEARRVLNARNHSAGHLIDCAVEKSSIEGLKPTKGFHFPEGPYVEYEGMLERPEQYITELQSLLDELVSQDLDLEKKDYSEDEAKKEGISAPPGKQVRVVNFQGFSGCGCGGTHVSSTSKIGKITLRKIKSKKGNTKIAYSVES